MNRTIIFISLTIAIGLFPSCKKKKTDDSFAPEPLPQVSYNDDRPACEKLPPTPVPLGWRDSLYNENTNVNAFLPNPLNANEVLCVVNGDAFGNNKLLSRNLVSKTQKQIAILGNYLPDVNRNGWITYSDVNDNIFIVKANGDSLKQLTFDKLCVDPKWDYQNKLIFFLRKGMGSSPPQLYQVNMQGNLVNMYDGELPYTAVFNRSNKYIYLKTSGSFCNLVQRNLDSLGFEKILLSAPLYASTGRIYFEDLTLDGTDENLYWSNSAGICRCNLKTRKIDTVFKNCENSVYANVLCSINPGEMTYTLRYIKPLNSTVLLYDYLPMEWNLQNNSSRLFRIFER